jgi:hypothetical protein
MRKEFRAGISCRIDDKPLKLTFNTIAAERDIAAGLLQ